jgi:hypothetical protein
MIRAVLLQIPYNLARNLSEGQTISRDPEHARLVDLLPTFATSMLKSHPYVFESLVNLLGDGGGVLFGLAVPAAWAC